MITSNMEISQPNVDCFTRSSIYILILILNRFFSDLKISSQIHYIRLVINLETETELAKNIHSRVDKTNRIGQRN